MLSFLSKKKTSHIRNSGANARKRYEEKLEIVLKHLLQWRMIDIEVCMGLLNLKKTGAADTLRGLEKRGFLQTIPTPHLPTRVYMLTKMGAEELQRYVPFHEFLEPVIHPSRINARQMSHDLLTMLLAVKLYNSPDKYKYFFGGSEGYLSEKFLKSGKHNYFIKTDTELRAEMARWYENERDAVAAPRYAVGKLADAVIGIESKGGKALGTCFIEVQESYEKPRVLERNLSHYVRLINSGELGVYDSGAPATMLIYASTRPEILNYVKEKLSNLNEWQYDHSARRWSRTSKKLEHIYDRQGQQHKISDYVIFVDLSLFRNRYYLL